jgi:hypothetical protein
MTNFSTARALLTILLTGGVMGCSTTGTGDTSAGPVVLAPSGPAIPASSPASPPASSTAASPASPSAAKPSSPAAAFPLVVSRTGGFAGVDDRVTIQADGSAVVTRRGQKPVHTSVPATETADLRKLLAAPQKPAPAASGEPVCADGFHYEISSPALKAVVEDCGGPRAAAVSAVLGIATRLLNG